MSGYGFNNIGNYFARQWDLATGDTINYFFNAEYNKAPLFGNLLGGGYAGPSLGGALFYGGFKPNERVCGQICRQNGL